jgi:hypothetical protein
MSNCQLAVVLLFIMLAVNLFVNLISFKQPIKLEFYFNFTLIIYSFIMKGKSNLKQINTKTDKYSNLLYNNKFIYFLLGITVLFVLIARIHLLSFPFERDEGEYAYMGKLILDGHPPYTLAYNMKLPGTYYMYAIIMMIFGKSIVGVHIGLAFITIASMFLVFLISRKFVSKIGAIISTASFGIIGTSWTLLAQAAHATHFVIFFALLGILVILQLYESEKNKLFKYFISGVFFSLAFICKQSGLFFVFFGITIIITNEFNVKPLSNLIKHLLNFLLGFAVPVIIMFLYFYFFADFGKFRFWTIEYLSKYSNQIPISEAPNTFKLGLSAITANYSSVGYIALWVVSVIGIPLIFINKASIKNKILVLSFLLFSFLTIIPGFYFRNHYFITLLPAVALLIAVFFDFINNFFIYKLKMPNLIYISFLLFIILIGNGIKVNVDYLFKQNPEISCKQVYGTNPFVESIQIAKFLKQNTTKDDKIAVFGSEPQICFYADRYSATGYIYTYNLVELHSYALTMQQEMAKEIEISKPKYLLSINVGLSWLTKQNSEKFIFTWVDEYIDKNYRLVGLYDILPNKFTSLKVGEQLNNYKPQSQDLIYIFERNQ